MNPTAKPITPNLGSATGRRKGRLIGVAVLLGVVGLLAVILLEQYRRRSAASVVERQVAIESPAPSPGEATEAVQGVVFAANGQPAVGALVELHRRVAPWPSSESQLLEEVRCGADGRFRCGAERGLFLFLRVRYGGHATQYQDVAAMDEQVQVRLEPGHTLAGTVLASDRRVLMDARVIVEGTDNPWRPAISVITDRKGRFVFSGLPAGFARIVAQHPDLQPMPPQAVPVGVDRDVYLVMPDKPAVRVTGEVLDGLDGSAVAGAQVRIWANATRKGLTLPVQASTDADGRFDLEGLAPGVQLIEVRAPGMAMESREVVVQPGRRDRFEVFPAIHARGRIKRDDGEPLPEGGRVFLLSAAGEMAWTDVDQDGAFVIPGQLSPGRARLAWLGEPLAFTKSGGLVTSVMLEDQDEVELELSATAPGRVSGRVVDGDGQAIEGARLVLLPGVLDQARRNRLLTVTDAEGGFRFWGIPEGEVAVQVQHPDWAWKVINPQVPPVGRLVQLPDTVLPAAGSMRGQVLRSGREQPGAYVEIRSGLVGPVGTITDRNGRYVLENLAPGEYLPMATWPGAPTARGDRPTKVEPGGVVDAPPLRIQPGREIGGLVVNREGQPVPFAEVSIQGDSIAPVITDSEGRFTAEIPDEEQVELVAHSPLYDAYGGRLVVPEDDSVRIVLPVAATGRLRVQVLAMPEREPVTSLLLRMQTPDGGRRLQRASRMVGLVDSSITDLLRATGSLEDAMGGPICRRLTSRDGWFEINGLPAGDVRVTLQAPGLTPFRTDLQIEPVDPSTAGDDWSVLPEPVLLEPGASLWGRVVNEAGEPISDARVWLGSLVDMAQLEGELAPRTDARGGFRLGGVNSTTTTLLVSAPGYAAREVALNLPADLLRQDPLEVTLGRGSRLEVLVRDRDGAPMTGLFVELQDDFVAIRSRLTGPSGRVVFDGLCRGQFSLGVRGFPQVGKWVQVPDRGTVQDELVIASRR